MSEFHLTIQFFINPYVVLLSPNSTLRHLVQYSTLISPVLRAKLLQNEAPRPGYAPTSQLRSKLLSHPTPLLSEFPSLLSGSLKFKVPVYTVWGACEDVAILERFRTGEYQIENLHVLDEASSYAIEVGGVRLRLFGLGGAVVLHKLFDNGEGAATIAGGQGTMWTTVLQIGELVDTAQKVSKIFGWCSKLNVCPRVEDHDSSKHTHTFHPSPFSSQLTPLLQTFDPTETRLLITHASPGREGLLAQLALALKADLTLSAGLHFRYGVSYNEFSVQHDSENFRNKLVQAKSSFGDVWETVRSQVESVIDDRQRVLLNHALAVTNRVPPLTTATGAAGEEPAWKNTWNWNLPDAAYGSLVLELKEGRVSAEMKSQGFNFAYRKGNATTSAITPVGSTPMALSNSNQQQAPNTSSGPATNKAANAPLAPAAMSPKNSSTPNGAAAAAAPSAASPKPITSPTAPIAKSNPDNAPPPNAPTGPSSASSQANKKKKNSKTGSIASISASERGHVSGNETSASKSDVEGPSGATSGNESAASGISKKPPVFGLAVRSLEDALPVSEQSLRKYFGIGSKIEKDIKSIKLNFSFAPKGKTNAGDESGKESGKEDSQPSSKTTRPPRIQKPLIFIDFNTKEIRDEASKFHLTPQGQTLKGDDQTKTCSPKLEISDRPTSSSLHPKKKFNKIQDAVVSKDSEKENNGATTAATTSPNVEKKEKDVGGEISGNEDSKSTADGGSKFAGRGRGKGNRGRGGNSSRGARANSNNNGGTPSGAVAAAE